MKAEINIDGQRIMSSIARLQSDISFVREHIEDVTLTKDDLVSIEQAEIELKEGRTISHEQLKKELGF